MSSNLHINHPDLTAPTPQNTPLQQAPIAAGLSRPTVPDINEDNEGEEEDANSPSNPAFQNAMLGLVHGRLAGLLGKSSGYIESLPIEVKRSVEGLKGIQTKQTELQNQYKRECLELERKVCRHCPLICHSLIPVSVLGATQTPFRATTCDRRRICKANCRGDRGWRETVD